MQRTEYAPVGTDDLIEFTLLRDNSTTLEIELAQRLDIAMGMLEDEQGDHDFFVRHDARRSSKVGN